MIYKVKPITKISLVLFIFLLLIESPILRAISIESNKQVELTDNFNNIISTDNEESKSLKHIIEPGDLIVYLNTEYQTNMNSGHCRLFKEYNPTTDKYTIISTSQQVRSVQLSEEELYNFAKECSCEKVIVVKIDATAEQKQNAIAFADQQIGKYFDFFFRTTHKNKNYNPKDNDDPSANKFYCTELNWASYYNCNNHPDEEIYGDGIDIDHNGWEKDMEYPGREFSFIYPSDIIKDDNVKETITVWEKNMEDKSLTYPFLNRLLSMISEKYPILNLLAKLIQRF
jgi:uncharacterized protein YycO